VSKDMAVSIRARLLNLAKAEKSDFDQVLVRFALERLLYRLGQSEYADKFLLKGALLFVLWYDLPHRATRDVDLLGYGQSDIASVVEVFTAVLAIRCDDGIHFDLARMIAQEIRKDTDYVGVRISLYAELSRARCRVQIDIGYGDAVTPRAMQSVFPTLLKDLPQPQILVYPVYTVIAEKLHAIVLLGFLNSRLKDYSDLVVLITHAQLDQNLLQAAITATFARRNTVVPTDNPVGLSIEFSQDNAKQQQWAAFLSKNNLPVTPLSETVEIIRSFAAPFFVK
jgi:hypothetical protein